jgi:mannose-6-phosphate isomerase-like protein (cupin superfamily)
MFLNYLNPVSLSDHSIQLREGRVAEASTATGVRDAGLWTVAHLHADDGRALHSDVWERHPSGDEVLCVLSGLVEVFLRDHRTGPAFTLNAGEFFLVPRGVWHRLDVREPAELIAITPRVETQHERMASSQPLSCRKGEL